MASQYDKPTRWPWEEKDWEETQPPSYYEWKTPRPELAKDDRRKIRRDPNHPRWNFRYSLLTWWHIRIRLIGTDPEGRHIVMIRQGDGEPIYIRFGKTVELYRAGKRMKWDDDVDTTPITAENQRLRGKRRYIPG